MGDLTSWTSIFFSSLQAFGEQIMGTLPSIIGALLIIFIGWFIAKIMAKTIAKILHVAKFDLFAEKINATDYLEKANVSLSASQVVGKVVYWIIILLVIITASEAMGWDAVSVEVSKLIEYLPKLMVAIIFFLIGTYIATFVRDFIRGAMASLSIGSGKVLSSFVFYLLFTLVALTALEQAGMDTTIITSNLLLILGTIMVSAAISYGFASREILSNILAGFYTKKQFRLGQVIEIEEVKGRIVAISNISVTVQINKEEQVVIPINQLVTNRVKIYLK